MEHSPQAEGAAPQYANNRVLEQLFRALEKPLLAYAMRITRQSEAAQDCVQEAFLRLHPRLVSGEVRDPSAWLYRTIHNLAISGQRESRKIIPFDTPVASNTDTQNPKPETHNSPAQTLADPAPMPDAEVEKIESAGLARLVLERLEPRTRQVVTLKFFENLSYKEISARTGLSVSHVGYILHHALKELSKELALAGLTR